MLMNSALNPSIRTIDEIIADISRSFQRPAGLAVDADKPETVVLLVSDVRVRELLETWLAEVPVLLRIASTGWDAHDDLETFHDGGRTLITDRAFPPWPGLPGIQNLKRQMPDLRVIFVQVFGTSAQSVAEKAGADVGLNWPLSLPELISAMDLSAEQS